MCITAVTWLLACWGSFSFTKRPPSENGASLMEDLSSEWFTQLYKQVQLLLLKAVPPQADLKSFLLYRISLKRPFEGDEVEVKQ